VSYTDQLTQVCECGHPASAHELLDHDKRTGDSTRRRSMRLARFHLICTADVHGHAQAESPWDHVCGCIANVWEQEDGVFTIADDTPEPMRLLLRSAVSSALDEEQP
jgi:hypothetical protein